MATCKLWCRRGELLIAFDAEIGTPMQRGDQWHCKWSVGEVFPFGVVECSSETSLHALAHAMSGITRTLIMRVEAGDLFYIDPDETDEVEDFEAFLPILRSRNKIAEQDAAPNH